MRSYLTIIFAVMSLFGNAAQALASQETQPEPEYFALFMDGGKIGHGSSLRRIDQDRDAEFAEACRQVERIAELRLKAMFSA